MSLQAGPELDALVAEKVFQLPGIGHYGPTKRHGSHLDQKRCDTHEEAMALYREFWPEDREGVCATWKDINATLNYWKDGWGTLLIPDYSTDIDAAWDAIKDAERPRISTQTVAPALRGGSRRSPLPVLTSGSTAIRPSPVAARSVASFLRLVERAWPFR